jgi:hypothetical protein
VLKLSKYARDKDSKWSATTIGDDHTVMPHVELSFVRGDVKVESEATSQNGELETLYYVKQELGGGSKAESFARWRGLAQCPSTGAREATKKRPRIPLASERKQLRGEAFRN